MKKFSLSAVTDSLFGTFVLFILFYVLLDLIIPRPFSLIFAFMVSGLLGLLLYKRLYHKSFLNNEKMRNNQKIFDAIVTLNYLSHTKTLNLFLKAINSQGKQGQIYKGVIKVKEENVILAPLFNFDGITKTDVVRIFNLASRDDSITIYSENFSNPIKEFASKFGNITLLDGVCAYKFLEEFDCLPKTKLDFQKVKDKPKFFKNFLLKSQAKKFFAFGIFFLLSCFFVPLKTYYVIVGSIMLFLSLLCLIFGKKQSLS